MTVYTIKTHAALAVLCTHSTTATFHYHFIIKSSQFFIGDAVTLHHGSFVEKRKNGYRDARGSLVNTHCNNQALTSVPEVENPAFFID